MTPSITELAKAVQDTSVARDAARDSRMFSKPQWEQAILAHENAVSAWHKNATPEAWLSLTSRVEMLEGALKDAQEALGREIAARRYEPMDASGTYNGTNRV